MRIDKIGLTHNQWETVDRALLPVMQETLYMGKEPACI